MVAANVLLILPLKGRK